ncbi:MAG: hypothetical protein AB8B80_10265 [Marinicellaceae bacterium]
MMRFIIIFLTLFFTFNLVQAVVLVGPSGQNIECGYQTIQEALDSGDPEIRVVNDGEYIENLTISSSVSITGGYGNCFGALLNQLPNDGGQSVINGSFLVGAPVINVSSIGSVNVSLANLTIKNASDTIFVNGGHGIDMNSSIGSLTIDNSLIFSNTAENGGGIHIDNHSGSLSVLLRNSSVFGNSASNNGGGIYCGGSNTSISIRNQSYIGENMADNGGGIAAMNGCTINIDSGIDVFNSQELRGVMNNSATNNGGGIYLDNAELALQGNIYSLFNYGNNRYPVTVSQNSAMSSGGGIFAQNNATLTVTDAQISLNTSTNNGAGIFLGADSELIMMNSNKPCWQPGKCSVLSHNSTGLTRLGGALYASLNSIANIHNTSIHSNRAAFGSVFYAFNSNSEERSAVNLDGNYIYENADNGNGGYTDSLPLRAFGFVDVQINHNTIAGNDINDSSTIIGISGGVDLDIMNTIIDNQEELILTTAGEGFTVDTSCLLVNENDTIVGSPLGIFSVGYVDADNNDYRLNSQSFAIDTCANSNGVLFDNENQVRGWDDNTISNLSGTFDVGADESYLSDIIFGHDFL